MSNVTCCVVYVCYTLIKFTYLFWPTLYNAVCITNRNMADAGHTHVLAEHLIISFVVSGNRSE